MSEDGHVTAMAIGVRQTEEELTMSSSIETLLRRNLQEVFSERDASKRRSAIREVWTEDCVFCDSHGLHNGQDALEAAVVALHNRLPDHVFTEASAPQALVGAGRMAWRFGPPGKPDRITGLDVIVTRGEKIAALYAFLDKSPA
jgi:hypothetical protein